MVWLALRTRSRHLQASPLPVAPSHAGINTVTMPSGLHFAWMKLLMRSVCTTVQEDRDLILVNMVSTARTCANPLPSSINRHGCKDSPAQVTA
eukprot:6476508-Amphidinium_carterae.1